MKRYSVQIYNAGAFVYTDTQLRSAPLCRSVDGRKEGRNKKKPKNNTNNNRNTTVACAGSGKGVFLMCTHTTANRNFEKKKLCLREKEEITNKQKKTCRIFLDRYVPCICERDNSHQPPISSSLGMVFFCNASAVIRLQHTYTTYRPVIIILPELMAAGVVNGELRLYNSALAAIYMENGH